MWNSIYNLQKHVAFLWFIITILFTYAGFATWLLWGLWDFSPMMLKVENQLKNTQSFTNYLEKSHTERNNSLQVTLYQQDKYSAELEQRIFRLEQKTGLIRQGGQ